MWQRTKFIWANHKPVVLALALVLAGAGIFGSRIAADMLYWADPAKQDQPLQGWMTPRYVGKSYAVPPEVIMQAFDLRPESGRQNGGQDGGPRRVSLERLAADHGLTLAELQARLDAAVLSFRLDQARGERSP